MVLNYGAENAESSDLKSIDRRSLKRRSYSEPLLKSKRTRYSGSSDFLFQWMAFEGQFQIDEEVPSYSSNQQLEREKDDHKRKVNNRDQSSSTNDLLFVDANETKNKNFPQNSSRTKCKICLDTQEFDKTAQGTYEHNTDRRKFNSENMCSGAETTKQSKNWTSMELSEKFPYYYITHNKRKLTHNGFNNFLCFLEDLENNKTPLNFQEAQRIWTIMSFDQKLPFLFEAFLSHMADLPSAPVDIENDIKYFLRKYKK